jgi:hypothetical protein
MVLARLVTMMMSAWICYASLAFEGAFPAMLGLEMLKCLVLGSMVRTLVFKDIIG